MDRTQYIVTEENTLAYIVVADGMLKLDGYIFPFALASNIHGHDWRNGGYCIHKDQSRPATLADFETFRCQPPKGIIFGTGETYVAR